MKTALLALCLSVCTLGAHAAKLSINTTTEGPLINKDIYGQFAEHLGDGIYKGIYVGEGSKIPNTQGFRNDVVGALKALDIPLLRWPGGCFADEYHWRDGIGPQEHRPARVNTTWGGVKEDNSFGTHEFFQLVDLLDTRAYINGNLGTGTPQEMAEWVEYMTGNGTSSVSQERKKNGRDAPWEIAYFGVGNEAWGCGGHMRPEYYTDLYNHYATFLKFPWDSEVKLVASGGSGDETHWTRALSTNKRTKMGGISHHYYTLPTENWDKHGRAIEFDEQAWIDTLKVTLKIDGYIENNIKVLDKYDPEGALGFYVDEWGTWYDQEPEDDGRQLYQQNTLRDAMVAALNLNIFHKYAKRVHMANIAQMVNVLQAMILTKEDKMLLTPTYHVFNMYKPFQDATLIPTTVKGLPKYRRGGTTIAALSASVAKTKTGAIVLAVANTDPHQQHTLKLSLDGQAVKAVSGEALSADALDAHNTFASPERVKPQIYNATLKNGELTVPGKSILVLTLN